MENSDTRIDALRGPATDTNDPFAVLVTPPPAFDEREVAELLRDQFDLGGKLSALPSERDQNFSLTVDTGAKFVVKISNPAEDPVVTDFQNRVLEHLSHVDLQTLVPTVLRATNGERIVSRTDIDGRSCAVRVLTWQYGVPLVSVEAASLGEPLGHCLADLDARLAGFSHPGQHYSLLWDVSNALQLAHHTNAIQDATKREMCERHLDRFESAIAPVMPLLRSQVIYNDMNPGNILVDPENTDRVVGIIDFGDIVHAPLIVDLAVACSYLCGASPDSLDDTHRLLSAYSSRISLEATEVELLFDLILTRLAIGIIIAHWRVAQFPGNKEYIMVSESRTSATLAWMAAQSRNQMSEQLANACGIRI